jgi:hypothetical protein
VPDVDLLELLSADHRNLVAAESDSFVASVLQHVTVERTLLYPAIEEYESDGRAIVEDLRDADHVLEQRLGRLEADPTPENRSDVDAAIRAHVARRQVLFPQLRRTIPASRLEALADEVPLTIGGSPTRPHPHLPDHGALGEVAEQIEVIADRLHDKLHHDESG